MRYSALFFCLLTLWFTGCQHQLVVPVDKEAEEALRNPAKPDPDTKIFVEDVFARYQQACLKRDWKTAYGFLGRVWRSNVSIQSFQEDMEKEGLKVLSSGRLHHSIFFITKETWLLRFGSPHGMYEYVIGKENLKWRIQGIRYHEYKSPGIQES